MIIHIREKDTPDGRFWVAEGGDFEVYRRSREQALFVMLTALSGRMAKHLGDASTLTICVAQRDGDHHISCDIDEDCQCGS